MNSAEDYYQWFKAQAQELPYREKLEVLTILDTSDYRKISIELLRLRDSGTLPREWSPVVDNFYGSVV